MFVICRSLWSRGLHEILTCVVYRTWAQDACAMAAFNPTSQLPVLVQDSGTTAGAGAPVKFTFSQGLTSNTDYTVTLIARDVYGNCERNFTTLTVHTADNIPPVTLGLTVLNVTGTTAELHLQLDEPGTAYFAIIAANDTCPPAASLFASGAAASSPQSGTLPVPQRAPAEAVQALSALNSQTAYSACVVAEDATQQHNRQTAVQRVGFTTLDITPPAMTITLAPAADGDVVCARAAPYKCSASWSATISEPGVSTWVLLRNDSSITAAALPSPAALLSQPLSVLFSGSMQGAVVVTGNLSFPPNPSAPVALVGLPSKMDYLLIAAARDVASPTPNTAPALIVVPVKAPDVEPPEFTSYSLAQATDTSLNFSISLDESSTTYFVLVTSPSVQPNVSEVMAATARGGAAPVTAGSVSSVGNSSAGFSAEGLVPGQMFDLHMAAVDTSGNKQANVTTLRWVSRVLNTEKTCVVEATHSVGKG